MPSDRYRDSRRSRSRSRGRYSDKKVSRRSRSPYRRRSRSPRRNRRDSRSPRRYQSRSPKINRRRSRTPERNLRRSRTPEKARRRSITPEKSRHSRSVERVRQRSLTPQQSYRTSSKRLSSPSHGKPSSSTSQLSAERGSRYSRSRSRTPVDRRNVKRTRSIEPAQSPSPTTLDDVLMSEKPLSSKPKPSLTTRYEKYDINVISVHNKDKRKRSSEDIDNDGSAKDFFPTDVIELVHELNPRASSKKRFRTIFDREEIKNFVEQEVETKVIRLMPSADDMKKLEAHLGKTESRSKSKDSKSKGGRKDRDRSSKDGRDLLRREPEKRRYRVTDDDLLDGPPQMVVPTSRLESERDSKRSIQDRLGSTNTSDRDRPNRRLDDRLGRAADPRDRRDSDRRDDKYDAGDLRHSLSSKQGRGYDNSRDVPAPLVTDYGHRSINSAFDERPRQRERTPDFSKRPDKGKIDMMELDPTYVPRGGLYDQHDDRTRDTGEWSGRGGRRTRGFNNREGYRPPPRGGYNRPPLGEGRLQSGVRVMDHRPSKRKPSVSESWKHDKFKELEDETKAEPTSTTA